MRMIVLVCVLLLWSGSSVQAQLKVDAGADVYVCEGFSSKITTTAKGGTAPLHYSWSPAIGLNDATSPTPIVTPVQPRTQYVVTVTDATNATASDTVIVILNPKVYADAGSNFKGCVGSMITLGAGQTAHGGTGPYTYQWLFLPPNASSNSVANPTYTPDRPGYSRYILHVTDAVGCDAWDTVEITINQPLNMKIGVGAEGCAFAPHDIGGLGIAGGGTPPYHYHWFPERGLSSATISNPTAFPDSTTMYVLTVTDALGCTLSDSVQIKVKPRMHTQLVHAVTVCPNTVVDLAASDFVSGGTAPYRYKWTSQFGQSISNDTIANPTTTPNEKTSTGLILYTVDIIDAIGCHLKDSVYVAVTQPPGSTFQLSATVCQNDSFPYGVSGKPFYTYKWSCDGGQILSGDNTGTVMVRWTRAGTGYLELTVYDPITNCTSTGRNTTYVKPLPMPVIAINGVNTICLGSGVTTILDAGPGFASYHWSTGQGGQRIVVARGGTYTCMVYDTNGCRNTSPPVVIREVEPPKPVITGPDKICGGLSVQLHAPSGYKQYTWNTGATDSVLTINGPGNYSVTVSDSLGCTGTSAVYTVDPRPIMVTTEGDPNFEAVETGLEYPTKIVKYRNTTTEDVVIDSLLMQTTNVDLQIVSLKVGSTLLSVGGTHGLRLKPGQSLDIELQYNPTVKDVNTYLMKLVVAAPCQADVTIIGNLASYDKLIWATAGVDNIASDPGHEFFIPLTIQFDTPQDSVEDATLFISMKLNGYMMDVIDDAGGAILKTDDLPNSWKFVHMRFDHLTIKHSTPYLLTKLHCLALASRTLMDTMFVDDKTVHWEPGAVTLKKPRVRVRNGIFTLGTYCYPHDIVLAPTPLATLVVQPNPVREDLILSMQDEESREMDLELSSVEGRIIKSFHLTTSPGAQLIHLDVSDVADGVYPLVARCSGQQQTMQVVICK